MNTYIKYLIVFLFAIVLFSCEEGEQKTDCSSLEEWVGVDEECGCYGMPIAFSQKCITSFEDGDIPYIGFVNYGHLKDSILIILKNSKLVIEMKTVSDIPSLDTKGADIVWFIENSKPIQLLYDDSNWNNPGALGRGTELRLDPNIILEEPEQFSIGLFQREFLTFGSTILDSTSVIVTKDVGRK
jgi:hypothetical protein